MAIFFTSDTHFFHGNIILYARQTGKATRQFGRQNLVRDMANARDKNFPMTKEQRIQLKEDVRQAVLEMNEAIIADWNSKVETGDTVFHLGDVSFGRPDETAEVLYRLNGRIVLIEGNHDPDSHDSRSRKVLHDRCDSVHDYYELKIDGEQYNLFHYPIRAWNKYHHGSVHLHGHSHGTCDPIGRMLDVGWDSVGRVISLKDVQAHMARIKVVNVDHHDAETPR